jgi:hypothetical protein
VYASARRDSEAASRFFQHARTTTGCAPDLEQCEWLTADATVAVRWTGHDTIVPSLYVYRDIEDALRYVFRAEDVA